MIDRRGEPRLVEEARPEPLVLAELGSEQLQRHPATQIQVRGAIDDAHPAPPDHPLEAIATELGTDAGTRLQGQQST